MVGTRREKLRKVLARKLRLGVAICLMLHSYVARSEEPAKPDCFLITDYLPAAVYDRDNITVCFRVQNTSGSACEYEINSSATGVDDKPAVVKNDKIKVGAHAFGSWQTTIESSGKRSLKFELRKNDNSISTVSVRLLRDDEAWPETRLRNGHVEIASSGEILLPIVTRKLKVKDRAFLPMKWMLAKDKADAAAPNNERRIVFAPASWGLGPQYGAPDLLEFGPFTADAAAPILRAADQLIAKLNGLNVAPEAKKSLTFVICLPAEDLDAATEPRSYRIIVDAVLARFSAYGTKNILIVPPFHYGASEKFTLALWKEVDEAAAAYGVKSVDPSEYLQEEFWRIDQDRAGVYGPRPNARGLKKIAQGLFLLQ